VVPSMNDIFISTVTGKSIEVSDLTE
jgi:hypothetical protein